MSPPAGRGAAARIARLDWARIGRDLDDVGHATTGPLLTDAECDALIRVYDRRERFRSHVDMARHRFGEGEYRYFAAPLPPLVSTLRTVLYRRLAPIANRWMALLGSAERHPPDLAAYLARCAAHGQRRPTPLLLRYRAGGYNCLHRDLYGALAFPLQMTFLLSRPGEDFTGGELLLVEQRPRMQSIGAVVTLTRGEGVVFPNRDRPAAGARGTYRVGVRHGVSRLHTGTRTALGIIFHDAE